VDDEWFSNLLSEINNQLNQESQFLCLFVPASSPCRSTLYLFSSILTHVSFFPPLPFFHPNKTHTVWQENSHIHERRTRTCTHFYIAAVFSHPKGRRSGGRKGQRDRIKQEQKQKPKKESTISNFDDTRRHLLCCSCFSFPSLCHPCTCIIASSSFFFLLLPVLFFSFSFCVCFAAFGWRKKKEEEEEGPFFSQVWRGINTLPLFPMREATSLYFLFQPTPVAQSGDTFFFVLCFCVCLFVCLLFSSTFIPFSFLFFVCFCLNHARSKYPITGSFLLHI